MNTPTIKAANEVWTIAAVLLLVVVAFFVVVYGLVMVVLKVCGPC